MIPAEEELGQIDNGKQRLLYAAAILLSRADGTVFEDGLRRKAITDLADYHLNNFTHHFENRRGLAAELIRLLDVPGQVDPAMDDIMDDVVAAFQGDLGATLQVLCDGNFELVRKTGRRQVQLALWALMRDDPATNEALAESFNLSKERVAFVLRQTMERWSLEYRSPWDEESATAMFRALNDGLFIQAALGADVSHISGLAIASVYPMLTRFAHDENKSVSESLAVFGADASEYWRSANEAPEALPTDIRDRVLETLTSQLAMRGYAGLTLAHIAAALGVSAHQLAAGLGDLDRILCMSLRSKFRSAVSENEFDLRSDLFSRVELLRRQVGRIQMVAAQNVEEVRALLTMMTGGPDESRPAEELLAHLDAPLVRLLDEAQAQDELMPGVGSTQSARALLAGIFLRESLRQEGAGFPLDLISPLFREQYR